MEDENRVERKEKGSEKAVGAEINGGKTIEVKVEGAGEGERGESDSAKRK